MPLQWVGLLIGLFVGLFIFFSLYKAFTLILPLEEGSSPSRLKKIFGVVILVGQLLISLGILYFARREKINELSLGFGIVGGLLVLSVVIWWRNQKNQN